MAEKITELIIIVAALILACQVWYQQGYLSALKDVRKMLNDNRKEQERDSPTSLTAYCTSA